MKTGKLFFLIAALAVVFVSCKQESEIKTTIVDFEDVKLGVDTISADTSFISGNSSFAINDGAFWNGGIVCSAKKDTVTSGYMNEYTTIAVTGANKSKQFGVVYSPGAFKCPANASGNYSIKSIMLANSTYAYLDMKNGGAFGKKFAANDWFKVTITGYLNNVQTSSVDYYLADFRNGKSFISRSWNKVDVSALGKVDKVTFAFSSSDNGAFGMNTPAYVCIDDIEFTQTVSK